MTPVATRRSGWRRWVPWATLAVACLPFVVATVRALHRGWLAIGDNGLLLLRTADVATANHPLLGTWTSASLTAGRSINNPGPLWYDVLAPFVRIGGPSVGFAVGVMIANVAAVVGAALAARRIGGRSGGDRAMVLVTALSAALAWSMGSELLFDAWQPHAMILPFWLALVLAWGVAAGDLALLPWLVGVLSLVVQTHLSFVYVGAAVAAAAAAACVAVTWRTMRRGGAARRAATVVRVRRAAVWSIGVAVVAWTQPLVDQVAGEGNLGALLSGSGGDADRIGLRLGARFVASVVAFPPWFGRPGFTDTVRSTGIVRTRGAPDVTEGDIVGLPAAVFGLLVVALLLALVITVGLRRRSLATAAAGVVAATGVAAALVSMRLMPVGAVGLSPHTMRWLWPIAALVVLALAFAAGGWQPLRAVAVPVTAAVAIGLSLLNLPTTVNRLGPTADVGSTATAMALVDGLDGYDPATPVLFDVSTLRFAEPYSGPVLAALVRNGVDVVVSDEVTVRQLGERRRADGDEPVRLVLIEGAATDDPPPGARAISLVRALSPAERAELDALRPDVLRLAARDGLVLSDAGADAAAAGRIPFEPTVLAPGGDPADLEAFGWIGSLVADGFLELSADQRPVLSRYSELERRLATATVGLYELPTEAGQASG